MNYYDNEVRFWNVRLKERAWDFQWCNYEFWWFSTRWYSPRMMIKMSLKRDWWNFDNVSTWIFFGVIFFVRFLLFSLVPKTCLVASELFLFGLYLLLLNLLLELTNNHTISKNSLKIFMQFQKRTKKKNKKTQKSYTVENLFTEFKKVKFIPTPACII